MIYRDNLTFNADLLRPALRLGFAKSRKEHLKIFLGEGRDAPVVEGPHFQIVTMTREDLDSLPAFRYYG